MSDDGIRARRSDEPRRRFTEEFKAGAVRLVLEEGKSVGAVARELDLTESALRKWVEQRAGRADQGQERADDSGARGARAAPQRECASSPRSATS